MRRVVVVKADGLPGWLVERMLSERDPATGNSPLPRMERIFVNRGVWMRNFYSRGVSLSVPAWSILDTGKPMVIHGNVEYDRYTLRVFDYLNFIPFYFKSAFSKAADMPTVEALDDLGVPLLSDRFEFEATHQSFQLFQRGISWNTLKRAARGPFPLRSPRRLIGEMEAGFEFSGALQDEMERALIEALDDESVEYLDLYSGEFDHLAHLDNSAKAQRAVAQRLDALVGRIWSAIEKSSLAEQTLLALVSDHGMNASPGTYSQGYNLVELFRSVDGGGHHVITNRYPLADYKVRGLDPFVHEVVTSSDASPYRGAAKMHPTVLLDLDGNERAAVHLRNSDLNRIHLLLQELERQDLEPDLRSAAAEACRRLIGGYAMRSEPRVERMQPQLDVLKSQVEDLRSALTTLDQGIEKRRAKARLSSWNLDETDYRKTLSAMHRLFSTTPGRGGSTSKVIPARFMGEPNTIRQLQNYVVSLAEGGLKLAPDGSLDEARSFRSLDYFRLLQDLAVRNVVQEDVGRRPVDFVAVGVRVDALSAALPAKDAPDVAVWLYGGHDRQLLILARGEPAEIKVLPVARLREDGAGRISFERVVWRAGLPLELMESDAFAVPPAERGQWLAEWRSERDWLRASHRTRYANAVVSLYEQFRPPDISPARDNFHWARRELVQADLLVMASDHWNFNARGFNPGGNHGGLFRKSAHSVLMMAGGAETGLGRGLSVDEPYDAMSFAPTLLRFMGRCEPDLPGAFIREAGEPPCEAPTGR